MRDEPIDQEVTGGAIDRRTILGRGAALFGALFAGQVLKLQQAKAQEAKPQADRAARITTNNTFTVTLAGETMATRPFSMHTEAEFLDIVKLFRASDLAVGHLEMNFGTDEEIKWTPRGTAGVASYMLADPAVAKDLRWMGIHALSLAMNHSFDWGPEGIVSTIKHCRANGIATAGTGGDLETARAPGYFEVDKARVGLVSIASGNNLYEWAGYGKGKIPGRPGINPLRVRTRYQVPKAAADQLKAIGKGLGVLSDVAAARPVFNITPGGGEGAGTGTASFAFEESDKYAITSAGHPRDIEDNLRSIDEAAKLADFVIVAHHNSTSEGERGEDPSRFVVDFAHKAIDTGADLYIGHGWHTFLGIEIYKGKPIIYGVGNFFYESGFLTRMPADAYESYGFDLDKLVILHKTSGNRSTHPGGNEAADWAWSAIPQFVFADVGTINPRLTEIRLYPYDLGMDYSSGKGVPYRSVGRGSYKYLDGSPRLAYGANGREILTRVQALCARRNTKMDIIGNIGVVRINTVETKTG